MAISITRDLQDENDFGGGGDDDAYAGQPESYKIDFAGTGDRRAHRRHDLDRRAIAVSRWGTTGRTPEPFGHVVDLSAGGLRIRTTADAVPAVDGRIRIRLELPVYAGICPFIDTTGPRPRPTREWVGWMTVARVRTVAGTNQSEVAGRLVGMSDADRGMLGLYLSTQPLAA